MLKIQSLGDVKAFLSESIFWRKKCQYPNPNVSKLLRNLARCLLGFIYKCCKHAGSLLFMVCRTFLSRSP